MPIICTRKFRYRKDGDRKATWRTFHERDVLTEADVIAFATARGLCLDTAAPATEVEQAADAGPAVEQKAAGGDGVEPPVSADGKAPETPESGEADESAPSGRRPRR